MNDARNFHVIDAVPDRLDISPRRSHRRWSQEAKARLIDASLAPGVNVSAIALEAGIAPSQLFGWRRKALKDGAVNRDRDEGRLGFVEIVQASSTEGVLHVVCAECGGSASSNELAHGSQAALSQ